MRKILFIMMMCVSLGVSAQSLVNDNREYEVVIKARLLNNGNNIIETPDGKVSELINKEQEPLNFGNSSELILYFTKRGWSFACSQIFVDNGHDIECIYLKKNVKTDDEYKENLTIREKAKKR